MLLHVIIITCYYILQTTNHVQSYFTPSIYTQANQTNFKSMFYISLTL